MESTPKLIKQVPHTRIFIVDSEPGDHTRYRYLVFQDSSDDYTFAPTQSIFRFPQRLSYWEALPPMTDEKLLTIAIRENCNPYTLRECMRTLIEIREKQDE